MDSEKIKILLVEDNPGDARLVKEMLSDSIYCSFDFNHAENISSTINFLNNKDFDVLLLDLSLPDSIELNGMKSIVNLYPDLPIVVFTGIDDEKMAFDAVQNGAQDYLVKGQGGTTMLTRSLRYAIERKRTEQKLLYMSQYDALTRLPNRVLFFDRLNQAIKFTSRTMKKGALMILDLDYFKDVNDTLGHLAGDQLLIELAMRLKSCIRDVDTVSRLGGDEFTIILNEVNNRNDAKIVAKKIKAAIKKPIHIAEQEIIISTSIGIILFHHEDKLSAETIIKHADMAMYAAKEKCRGSYAFYEKKMDNRVTQRTNMISDLRFGLERNEFELFYQPQINLSTGLLIGVEALIRWQHPKHGLMPPSSFVPLLEETGLIVPVGDWVLTEACKQNHLWQTENAIEIRVAVNLSTRQFHQKKLVNRIKQILNDSHLSSKYLQIEVTESTLMTNCNENIMILSLLRDQGIHLSIDDFGTGFSSLSYLRLFPFQTLKIDRSFVKEIATQSNVEKIMTAVFTLAHSLDMKVVAEGVESESQLPFLMENGCDEVQGYFFGKPMSAVDCTNWIVKNKDYRYITAKTQSALGFSKTNQHC